MKSVVKRITRTLNTTLWLKIKKKKKMNIEMTGLSEFHVSDVQASPLINLPYICLIENKIEKSTELLEDGQKDLNR